ncbi:MULTISPECIES: thioredoxin family protein [unclassified Pseudomonas]|uniref:thioredoxin family protein n=1 Tax=unclassified Pseudomonas TaxID=196821 RepID=UPI00384F5EE4
MTTYQDLFAIGQTFDDFVSHGLPAEIDAVRSIQQKLAAPNALSAATQQRLETLKSRFHLLAAAEMWCPDCQINLAAMDALQRLNPFIDLALITKSRAEDALKGPLALERISIPLVLVLDQDFQLIGRFIERPHAVAQGGDALKADYRAGLYLESTIQDLLAIFEAPNNQN